MTKTIFTDQLIAQLEEYAPEAQFEIRAEVFNKNNDTERIGVIIRQESEYISPTIYIDDFYEDYIQKKSTISEIAREIWRIWESKPEPKDYMAPHSFGWECCSEKLIFQLISFPLNRQYLKQVPHFKFRDFAIVFRVVFEIQPQGISSMPVTNDIMKRWGITLGTLYQTAKNNTPKLMPLRIQSLFQQVSDYIGLEEGTVAYEEFAAQDYMMVVTNTYGINGAIAFLYPGVLEQLAEKWKSNLVIVPCSVHEVLIFPVLFKDDMEELSQVVNEVNRENVLPEEILSDHVYEYDWVSKELVCEKTPIKNSVPMNTLS